MLDSEREKFYFVLAMLFVASSPFVFPELVADGIEFQFNVFRFIALLFLVFPGPFVMELATSLLTGTASSLRANIKKPSVQVRHETLEPLEPTRDALLRRLEGFGFHQETDPTGLTIAFSKPQVQLVNSFIDHAFEGTTTLRRTGFGTEVTTTLQFKDTILLDTGETANLEALAGYFSMREASFASRQVPVTILGGAFMAYVVAVMCLVSAFTPTRLDGWITDLSLGTIGMIGFSLYFVQRDPDALFGYRLSLAGLFLCVVPLAAMLAPWWSTP